MTSDPVKVFSLTPRKEIAVLSMMELGSMTRDTVKAYTHSPTVAFTKAISRMISLVDRENLPGLKEILTTATGRMACNLVRESSCSQMEAFISEIGETTKGQERAK